MKQLDLACPTCKSKLNITNGRIRCPGCSKVLGTSDSKNKYFDLLAHNKTYYWGEISELRAALLNTQSVKEGYVSAVSNLESEYPGMSEYILSYSRADWIFSCQNLNQESRSLDIGSGWGSITFALSRHTSEVWSLESVPQRIDFQRIRARQEGRTNIHFVRSSWQNLPFPDNSFDLISVNGVLEWIGLSDFSQNPRNLQQRFLSEIYRILKPGGCLYIGIENRIALFLFLGSLDHSGLPFTSLMPRKLADLTVRLFRKTKNEYLSDKRMALDWPDYRTYTYTWKGYADLIRSVGFSKIIFNWVLSYNSPSESGLFDSQSFAFLLKHFKEHDFSVTFLSKLATRFGTYVPAKLIKLLIPWLSPNYLIYSYKEFNPKSFETKLLEHFPKATSFVRRSGTHGINSKINYFLLNNGRPVGIAKFSRFKEFEKSLDTEEKHLSKWNNLIITPLNILGRKVYFEPFLHGRVCQTFNMSDNLAVVNWLINFQSENKLGVWSKTDLKKEQSSYLEAIKSIGLPSETSALLVGLLNKYFASTHELTLPIVPEHGDFVKTNMIVSGDKVSVIDWEFFKPKSTPFFDLLTFVINQARVGTMPLCFEANFTGNGIYSPILKSVIVKYSQAMNIPIDVIISAVPYCLVRTLHRRYFDKYGRHLDTKPLIDILNLWCKILPKVKLWIN